MSKTVEEWKDIKNFEGLYQVSDWGNVRSLDREIIYKNGKKSFYKGRLLSQAKDKNGYMILALGKYHPNKKVHRLVAEAFIPNPNNYKEVGHLDCDCSNNMVDNLYWCTRVENMRNPITRDRIKNTKCLKPIEQITLDGDVVAEYESLHKMYRETNYSRWAVGQVCKGKMKTYKGFIWKFK